MKTIDISKKTEELFDTERYNCAQASAKLIAEAMECSEEDIRLLTKAMNSFGGGICGTRYVCGAVSGSLAAISMIKGTDKGRATNMDDYNYCMSYSNAFIEEFENRFGTLLCGELTKVKRNDAEGWQRFMESGGHAKTCSVCVETAVRIALDLLNK